MANPSENGGRIDASFYDSSGYFAGARAHLDFDSPFQRYRVEKVLAIHTPGPNDRVLDLGCGWGTMEWALAPRVAEIVGVDFSAKSVELCERLLAERGHQNVRFLRADAGATGLPAASFDLVLAADFFEHLYPDDSLRVVAEAHRVLAPGGRFAIWTPHRGHLLEVLKNHDVLLRREVSHVDYKSMARLVEMLEDAGFTVEKAEYVEGHLPVVRWAERALQRFVPLLRRRIAIRAKKS